jgi:hypothetical protein
MEKRALSPLQLAYREFFLATLDEYNVKSPASLNYEDKRKFFTQIKSGWQIRKSEHQRKATPKAQPTKKEQYAKLKTPQSTIPLEPRTTSKAANYFKSKQRANR